MNRVGHNNDLRNAITIQGLVDITPNSKQFSLSEDDVDCMMNSLDNKLIVDMDVSNRCSYLIFDAGV